MAFDWKNLGNNLAANPLFAGGLQLMGAAYPTTNPGNPFTGVAPAMTLAVRNGADLQQMQLQQEEWEQHKLQRKAREEAMRQIQALNQQTGMAKQRFSDDYQANQAALMDDEPADIMAGGPIMPTLPPNLPGQKDYASVMMGGDKGMQDKAIEMLINPPRPEAPKIVTIKEGDKIVTYEVDPTTLKRTKIATADRYKPAGSQVDIHMPGQMTARPLSPQEASDYGLTPEQAKFLIVDGDGNLKPRPLIPGEAEAGKLAAEKSAKEEAAQAPRAELITMLDKLSKHPGFESIYGPIQGRTPNLTGAAGDAAALRDNIVANLSLENRSRMVSQGQISDFESRMLGQAATILSNPNITDEAAFAEVQRILAGLQKRSQTSGATGRWDGGWKIRRVD